ncbi:MAG: hypothetical protein CAK88_13540 [Verrucomicrobiia bacterium AMD-G2]|nr:MAG: hypothetical protein CAK88_13540 [Verrucomicrobiae bacterium AMD-G2]
MVNRRAKITDDFPQKKHLPTDLDYGFSMFRGEVASDLVSLKFKPLRLRVSARVSSIEPYAKWEIFLLSSIIEIFVPIVR